MATIESILNGYGEDKLDDFFTQPEEIIPDACNQLPISWTEYKGIVNKLERRNQW